MRAFELLSLGLSVAHAATLVARDTTISSSKRDPTYNQALGQANSLTTVNAGVTYWLSGGSTHIFRGNLNNFGTIIASQTDYLKQNLYAGGQTVNFVGTTTSNGNLVNNAGAVISINDYGSISAPTYDWYLHSMENYGSLQFCGRGDTGGSTYQLYCDLDCHNYGVIDFEQYNKNLGAAFVWRNTIVGSNPGVNIYNEGAFRLVNVVHHNVQNVLGSGCWVVDSGAVLYLEDGSGLFQNPTKGPTFPNQKIFFSNSGSGTLHMDTAVYSLNSNFGPNVYGFGVNRAIEFFETIKPLGGSSYSNGVLTVIFISGNKVNIKVGQGYDASAFYVARNPQPYNLIGYNAIFYRGAPPAQTVPAVCQVSLSVCGDPEKTAVSSPTTTSSTISSTTASSTTKSSTKVSSSPTLSTTTLATSTRTSSSSSASTTITTSSASSKTLTSSSSTSSSTSSAFSTTSGTSASSTTGKSSTTGPSSSSTSQSDSSTTTVTTTASSTYSSSRSSILVSSSTSSFVASTTMSSSTTSSSTIPTSSLDPSTSIVTTTSSTITTTTTTTILPVSSTTTSITSASTPTGGVAGYDRQNPSASKVDTSGTYGTYDTCKAYCQGFLSFAVGSNACLCYAAPIANNVSPVPSSPYVFYDIPGAESSTSTSTTTTSMSTTASAADSQFSSTSTSSTVASSSLSITASSSTTTSTTTLITTSMTISTTTSTTTPASSSTITTEITSIITSTSTSEIASTTTSITASATTSTTASTASSSLTGGVAGYDKQNPAAALTDSSGAYGTYDTCKTFCKNFVSFAVGAGTCLCYTAPIANNVSPVSSSPYTFYDMPGVAAGSSTSSTTTSVSGDLPATSSTQDISTTSSFTASTTTASISSSTSPSTSEAATATSSSTSTSTSTSSMTSSTPTPSNLCPNNTPPSTSYTTTSGDIYGLCPNTDFPAGDSSNVVGVKSIQACADLCSSTSGCIAASLLRDSSTCYMKTTRNAAVVNDGVDSAYLIVSGGASSSTSMTTTTTTTSAVGGSATS